MRDYAQNAYTTIEQTPQKELDKKKYVTYFWFILSIHFREISSLIRRNTMGINLNTLTPFEKSTPEIPSS